MHKSVTSDTLIVVDAYNLVFRLFYSGAVEIDVFFVYLNNILAKLPKGRVILVGDAPGRTWRQELCETYKQNRSSTPIELIEILKALPDAARKRGFSWLSCVGWEADDVVFTIADLNILQNSEIVVVAADKDLLVLLDRAYVRIWDNIKGRFVTKSDVLKRFGVLPKFMPDLLALAGDSSDNIPGVPKIGAKTAAHLINTYGSLSEILANLDKLPNDLRSNSLREHVEDAKLSYKLVQLRHVPLTDDDLGVRAVWDKPLSTIGDVMSEALQYGWVVFSETTMASVNYWTTARIVDYLEQLEGVRCVAHQGISEGFLESFYVKQDQLHARSACEQEKRIFDDGKYIQNELIYSRLFGLNKLPDVESIDVLHNLLYGTLPAAASDTQIAQHVELWQQMQYDLVRFKCAVPYYHCDRSLPAVLRKMQARGARINLGVIERLKLELEVQVAQLEQTIHDLAGREFLISSPQQLAQVLSTEMRLTENKKTDVLTLEGIDHPIISQVLEFRHINKLLNTYILPLQKFVDHDSRIHTSYTLTVTKTGRLSSIRPNLQNIPVKTELGRKLRSAFEAAPGNVLVAADYDQMELRLLAHMGPIPDLIDKLRNGVDWHDHVSQVLRLGSRRKAKTITFGLIYGMSAFGLKQRLRIDIQEAQKIRQMYYDAFPGMREYQEKQVAHAKRYGYVLTLSGRRCYVQPGPDMARQAINASIQGTAADIIKCRMQKIPHLIMQIHDELIAEVPEGEVETVARLMKEEMEVYGLAVPLSVSVRVGSNCADLKILHCGQ